MRKKEKFMPRKKVPGVLNTASIVAATTVILTVVTTLFTPSAWAASKERVLHSFRVGRGGGPNGVIFDAAGNLYGVTEYGGAHQNGGTVFELTPSGNGKWTNEVLYNFCSAPKCADGGGPSGGLTFDSDGNLYGTTVGGGAGGFQAGTVFRLSPDGKGNWTETVLHSFARDGQDGVSPYAGVVLDAAGNLYGTTAFGGGSADAGIVFQLMPAANGAWNEMVLHTFCSLSDCDDGKRPTAAVALDGSGNVYGVTTDGGKSGCVGSGGCGIAFELTPETNGKWTETVLHSFHGADGAVPGSALTFDAAGNLYGDTLYGGDVGCHPPYGCGAVFELIAGPNGRWTEKLLHSFYNNNKGPGSTLTFDLAGNLYGVTMEGGHYDNGTVFKLTLGRDGNWSSSTLYSFNGKHGYGPDGGIGFDASGDLFGTTLFGGDSKNCQQGCGVVFEITP